MISIAEESLLSRIVPSEGKEEILREHQKEHPRAVASRESEETREMLQEIMKEIELIRKIKEDNDRKFFELSKEVGVLKSSLSIKEGEINQLVSDAKRSFNELFAASAEKMEAMRKDIVESEMKVIDIKRFLSDNSRGVDEFSDIVDEKVKEIEKTEKSIIMQASKVSNIYSQIEVDIEDMRQFKKIITDYVERLEKKLDMLETKMARFVAGGSL